MEQKHDVVVGVDGSPESLAAVDWAAWDAARRGRRLHIIHACAGPVADLPLDARQTPALDEIVRHAAETVVDIAVARARTVTSQLPITTATPFEHAGVALIDASGWAGTVVVGSRGLGGFSGLLLGSVGVQLAAHAAGPVVVVRRGDPTDAGEAGEAGRVVVGVDGSGDTEHTLRFAFEQASYREAGLTAVHTYVWPHATGPGAMLPLVYDADDLFDDERRALMEMIGGWADKYPDVDVRHCTVRGNPAPVLKRLSHGAELMVVGSRGRGGFTGLLLGSVSQALIHHAACPVAVVR
ncbi:universal stress protein [Dactylosporangium sp. NPDC000521]|uniref:universal stress protein n=1 Tax=Dactylosporangium sp. NPDC000521 TaxID=3363975 RepID=UPI0036BA98FA